MPLKNFVFFQQSEWMTCAFQAFIRLNYCTQVKYFFQQVFIDLHSINDRRVNSYKAKLSLDNIVDKNPLMIPVPISNEFYQFYKAVPELCELREALKDYLRLCNHFRSHQALKQETPVNYCQQYYLGAA